MRICLVQMELPRSTVYGPDARRGFPIPDVSGWTPFQIEREDVAVMSRDPNVRHEPRVRLQIWLREDDS